MSNTFRAIVLEEEDRKVSSSIQEVDEARLPDADVTVDVSYSALNYKDGMIMKGLGRLVRDYPHVPGVDFAGTVVSSQSDAYKEGDQVILNGWRVGEIWWGGYATRARVKAEWLVPLPDGLSLKQSMAIGTAGYTAMLAIMALEDHGLVPGADKPVLITGAAGGVGSVATAVLAKLGHKVAASTGRPEQHDYLKALGASEIVDRAALAETPRGPLGSEKWGSVIDNVGGAQLGHLLGSVAYWGSVASVGNAGGIDFTGNVLPFLLRGINILGIDSNTCPLERRLVAWDRLSKELPLDMLDGMTNTIGLADVAEAAGQILQGQVAGRTVVDVKA